MSASNLSSSFTTRRRRRAAVRPAADRRAPAHALGGGAAAHARRLHERGFDDLDIAHQAVFQYPGPQGARPSELAARLRISKQALNYLLGELERLGYLERRPDPDDLRSKRIALTPRGVAAIGVIRDAVAELETAWAEQLGPKHFAAAPQPPDRAQPRGVARSARGSSIGSRSGPGRIAIRLGLSSPRSGLLQDRAKRAEECTRSAPEGCDTLLDRSPIRCRPGARPS